MTLVISMLYVLGGLVGFGFMCEGKILEEWGKTAFGAALLAWCLHGLFI